MAESTTKRWIAGALGVGALAAGAAAWWSTTGGPLADAARAPVAKPVHTDVATQPHATGAPAPPVAATGPAYLDGRYAATYAVEYHGASADQRGEATATLHLTGALDVAALHGAGSAGWRAVRLQVNESQANDAMRAATQLDSSAWAAALVQPFVVQLDTEGRVTAVKFARQLPQQLRSMFAAWAYAAQWVQPAQASKSGWQSHESDSQGAYSATYRPRPDGGVDKLWQHGGASDPQASADPTGREQTNRANLLREGARLTQVGWRQQGSLNLGSLGAGPSRASFAIELKLQRTGNAAIGWSAGLDPRQLAAFDPDAPAEAGADQAQGPPLGEVLVAMRTQSAAPAPMQRSQWRAAALAALQRQPSAASEMATALRHGGLSEPAERTLLEALAGSGAAAAQEVLVALAVDGALGDGLRDRAVVAATQVVEPSTAFVAKLLAALDGEHGTAASATYAVPLGAAVRNLTASDPVRAQTLSGELLWRARAALVGRRAAAVAAPTLADQRNWLAALGNAGDAAALPTVLELLHAPKEAVRLAAAHALRFQDPANCKEQMAAAMAADDAAEVRAALVHAARYMGPTAMQTFVDKAMRFDRAELVRVEAAYTVASWSVTAPGLRKLLATALAAEKSAKVQSAIQGLLAPAKPAGAATTEPK